AIVNEDASGDVLTMRIQIQQLKKEVSRLQGLVDGGIVNKEIDNGGVCFPGSPGSFKWEGLQGSFSPLASDKRQVWDTKAPGLGSLFHRPYRVPTTAPPLLMISFLPLELQELVIITCVNTLLFLSDISLLLGHV
ncbi:phragmoplast orienting kinesin, partial [Thalictrum thalictroides]